MKRYVFIISDGTGLTAESLSNSLLSQFEHLSFEKYVIPYTDTEEKARQVLSRINHCYQETGSKPLVFITIIDPDISALFNSSQTCVVDLFSTFLVPLEQELQTKSNFTVGKTHGMANIQSYEQRIEAVNYSLAHDDGVKTRGYDKADIVLIGVSRSGKTPSCLYMALRFGVLAANYPFTEDDLTYFSLPDSLKPYKKKLFGLTIDPQRLQQIRTERRPNSQYASLEQCRIEVGEVESMYQRENIPYLNSTRYSIEEISTKIMAVAGLERRLY